MENSYFEFQVVESAVGADVRESFGKLLGRGVARKCFYWIGSGRTESSRYCVQIIRVSSQNSDGKVSMGWMCEYSTYACAAGRSLCEIDQCIDQDGEATEYLTAPMSIARP